MKGNKMTIDEIKTKFAEYAILYLYDGEPFEDMTGGPLMFDENEPLFSVDEIFKEIGGQVEFILEYHGLIDEVEEQELEEFMDGFVKYAKLSRDDFHTDIVRDNGADYDIRKYAIVR